MTDISKEAVERLADEMAFNVATDDVEWPMPVIKSAADTLRAQAARIEQLEADNDRLRKLEMEYSRVECAIIMADPDFDGDSDHPDCASRLIASVIRLAPNARADALREVIKIYFEEAMIGGEASGWDYFRAFELRILSLIDRDTLPPARHPLIGDSHE